MSDTDKYPSNVEVRAWAKSKRAGSSVSDTGALPRMVIVAWNKAHPDRPYVAGQSFHGTVTGYHKYACRCDRCSEAMSEYGANYYANGGARRWGE